MNKNKLTHAIGERFVLFNKNEQKHKTIIP